MENRALGKGLSALIPEKKETSNSESVAFVKTTMLLESTFQPRLDFDSEKLSDLMASIKEKGVLQPLLVRQKESGYEVIAGERRFRAAKALSMEEVPVIIKNVSDQEALALALIENIQRDALNPIEEARGYQQLIDDFNLTQEQVAQSVGKNRSTITNMMRLLKLPLEIQNSLMVGAVSVGHARALLGLENQASQKTYHQKILKRRLSVRELESLINGELNRYSRRKTTKGSVQRDAHLVALEEELQKILGTKVRIKTQKKRGRIIIEYYSLNDLDRVLACIRKK